MWVKICANTNLEDALAAVELGADALGFVFAPSKRLVTPEQAGRMAAALPDHVERVGVFGAGSADEILKAAEIARLHTAQLHGGFDPSLVEQLRGRIQVIQTLHWTLGEPDAAAEVAAGMDELEQAATNGRALVDTKVGASPLGGTGRTFDWASAAPTLAPRANLRIVVAGGLKPENVAEAIQTLRPWGVDVASGVEAEPGRKDLSKLAAFIKNARRA